MSEPLAVGTLVLRTAQGSSRAVQEVAKVVGHTSELNTGPNWYLRHLVKEHGDGYLYTLRRPGGTGKGQVIWHEADLKVI